MAIDEKISKLVKNQFPDFYKEEGPNFLAFIEAYYAWMEENGNLTHEIRNLESYRDISTTTDEYIDYFFKTLLPSVPTTVVADKKLMAKYISSFNTSRGTFASYKLMFRAIYGEDIDLNLPSEQILKVSDGDWRIDRYLVSYYDENTYDFIGKTIVGTTSGATALVEDVVRRTIRGVDLMQILLSKIQGEFTHLESIRLQSDTAGTGHTPIIQAGIHRIEISSSGGGYAPGDIVSIVSDRVGAFGKVLIRETVDLNGSLSFTLVSGGSGYRPSTTNPGSTISFIGGDGTGASFIIEPDDINNSIPITVNWDRIGDFTAFGTLAPVITHADGQPRQMDTFANTVLTSPRYGFIEQTIPPSYVNFHDHLNAVLVIANSSVAIANGSSLYGATSGANAVVTSVIAGSTTNNAILRVDGYKNFQIGEDTIIVHPSGSNVGLVQAFSGNTAGGHMLNVAVSGSVSVGDELRGGTSGAYGVVKTKRVEGANTYLFVTANTSANLSSQFDTGPMKAFTGSETVYTVGTGATVGTVAATTSNTQVENVYTRLIDSFVFANAQVGTINSLSLQLAGSGYTIAPTISVVDTDIASLNVREYILTLQSDDQNWETGNSFFTTLSSGDRLEQSSSLASGYIVGSPVAGVPISVSQYGNGTYETSVRLWQDVNQTTPGILFANNNLITLKTYLGGYAVGNPNPDTRTQTNTGNAQVVLVRDNGILGRNAVVDSTIGANGTITAFKIIDSGFSYRNGETISFTTGSGTNPSEAQGVIRLRGAANSEGYYASSRSHISTQRGYIQDGYYYQEYSYEILSPISLTRYRDIALKLVHPAGQALFGKYRQQSNATVNVTVSTASKKRLKATGTIAFANGSFSIVGSGTAFTTQYANNGSMIIEKSPGTFYTIPLNIVSNDTTANTKIAWANTNLTSANIYYTSSSSSANIYYQVA